LVHLGYKVGAEIGVWRGYLTAAMLQAGLKMYAIDPWSPYSELMNQQKLDYEFSRTQRRLRDYPNATIIRKSSMEALADIQDGSLDFVYIDGNHEFRYVAEDIYEWAKKVRVGGMVAGHDYYNSQTRMIHVGVVVHAYVGLYGIRNWWVFGEEGRDMRGQRTWLFFKEERMSKIYYRKGEA
jgi:hypothetical protein